MNIYKIIITTVLFILIYFKSIIINIYKILMNKNCHLEKKIKKQEKKIHFIVSKLYYHNKYKIKTISHNYKIKKFTNLYIICVGNNDNLKIELPPIKNKKPGSKIYIKNISNKNIFIYPQSICEYNNLTIDNESIIIRPFSLVKIIPLNNKIYLVNKI